MTFSLEPALTELLTTKTRRALYVKLSVKIMWNVDQPQKSPRRQLVPAQNLKVTARTRSAQNNIEPETFL